MRKLLLLLFIAGIAQMIQAQTSPTFDPTWAAQFQEALNNSVGNSGGISAAVLVPGQGLWVGTSGESYDNHPITPDMRFGIGSNTKFFTAVILLKLQEEGVLSLDDHLGKWVGAYQYIDTSVTIRQMLSHQTGFFDYFNDSPALEDSAFSNPSKIWTPDEVLATIGAPHFAAGNAFSYSNTNYLLAALVIEAATGQTLEQNYHQYILDPYSMDSTFIAAFETPNGPVAHEWSGSNDLGDIPNTAFYSIAKGAGNIYSTPQEMVGWYRHVFNGDIIDEASLQQAIDFEPASHYALGIQLQNVLVGGDHVLYVHLGLTIGYYSLFTYDPKRNVATVVCVSGGADLYVFDKVQSVLYNHFPKAENDAGITSVVSPVENSCSATTAPIVTLKNFGSDILNSVDIYYSIDGAIPNVYSWTGSLDTSGSVNVSLPDINVGNGTHSFECYTSNPSSSPEGYVFNDTASTSFITDIAVAQAAPLMEDFSGATFPPAGWLATNNPNLTWQQTDLVPPSKRPAIVKSNYFDPNNGSEYDLCLPMLDLTGLSFPQLSFDHAYGPNFGKTDTLQVLISTDCGATYQILLNKFGSSLGSAATYLPYYPKDVDWKHNTVSLIGYSGEVLIKLRDISGGSNNLWIDNISVEQGTGIADLDPKYDVTVFPNPFENSTTILLHQPLYNVNLILYDLLGNAVKRINNVNTRSIYIERDGLPAGMYVFHLIQESQIVATGRIVAE
jgi:CubicO group peptidase (beta-lactamase class C family)